MSEDGPFAQQEEAHAYFLLRGHLAPDDVSATTGIAPSRVWRKGQRKHPRTPSSHTDSGWDVESQLDKSARLEWQVRSVLKQLRASLLVLSDLGKEYEAWIDSWVYLSGPVDTQCHDHFRFSWDVVQLAALLNAGLAREATFRDSLLEPTEIPKYVTEGGRCRTAFVLTGNFDLAEVDAATGISGSRMGSAGSGSMPTAEGGASSAAWEVGTDWGALEAVEEQTQTILTGLQACWSELRTLCARYDASLRVEGVMRPSDDTPMTVFSQSVVRDIADLNAVIDIDLTWISQREEP